MSTRLFQTCLISLTLLLLTCSEGGDEIITWKSSEEIHLGEFNPIGFTVVDSTLWISDSDHNQIGVWDFDGEQIDLIVGFDRPMHISAHQGQVYVPEYGSDTIRILDHSGIVGNVQLKDSLDAPAGVYVSDEGLAIADFYNHRILFKQSSEWVSYGVEGNAPGEFYYPTDLQISDGLIYVADAYNNRVQVLRMDGSVSSVFGKEHGMNGATGIHVSTDQVFVTDFENDRLLVFDKEGILMQTIEQIEKPTDALIYQDRLYVASYAEKKLHIFEH